MGFFSKLFGKKDSNYDVNPEDNQPQLVYGIPDQNKYDIKPEDNRPQKVYGIFNPTSFNKIIDIKNEIKDKCHKIMGEKGSLLEKYMDSLNVSDDRKVVYLDKLASDPDVVNEFAKYLEENSYDIPDAITVKERTAKIISVENPELTAIEVYIKLIEEKKQAGE